MSYRHSLASAAVAFVLIVVGLTLLFGPWALVGSGVVLLVVALLVPERERRGEPVGEASSAD